MLIQASVSTRSVCFAAIPRAMLAPMLVPIRYGVPGVALEGRAAAHRGPGAGTSG